MMVTFVSQCEKKALKKTRRVLDAFANRIGDNTWQTLITEDGLLTVKKMLRKTASRSTAVSCHWIRSRSRTQLLWVVGNRLKFNSEGVVPVNRTQLNLDHKEWESGWHLNEAIVLATGIAALFHDFGKANDLFQAKLKGLTESKGEPYRHEWVSLRLFEAFANDLTDLQWLTKLANIDKTYQDTEQKVLNDLHNEQTHHRPFTQLAPFAKLVAWLIVSHHRLPVSNVDEVNIQAIDQWLARCFDCHWNSANAKDLINIEPRLIKQNWQFSHGTPLLSQPWQQQAKKIAQRALNYPMILSDQTWFEQRFVAHVSRLSLMLADHYYSSLPIEKSKATWRDRDYQAFANTDRQEASASDYALKQKLDEHNIGVSVNAQRFVQNLPSLKYTLPTLAQHKLFTRRSDNSKYHWQEKAFKLAKTIAKSSERQGFFGVNMASTGCGKTMANARIMYGLSDEREGCRFSVALGLRTLTLQTGDAYRDLLKLGDDELAVLIGSQAVKALHQLNQHKTQPNPSGSDSADDLFEQLFISYEGQIYDGRLKHWLAGNPKLEQLISAPILVSTIDHLMPATESQRGGKQIAPMLRLLTSDLILDEPDDFGLEDMPALCRLVNWAGMLGARVLLSSATLPPSLIATLFESYSAGRQQFNQANFAEIKDSSVICAWIDEFKSEIFEPESKKLFIQQHRSFVADRVKKLAGSQQALRKGQLVSVDVKPVTEDSRSNGDHAVYQAVATTISQQIHALHDKHNVTNGDGRKVSVGVVRIANINPMIAVSKLLTAMSPHENYSLHFCVYHSQFPLALRSNKENRLDVTLTRYDSQQLWQQAEIQRVLEKTNTKNNIFVVLGTSVVEVGRDHDYDWAIAEPSSLRSLIQLAGRVQRHRQQPPEHANLMVLSQNIRALKDEPSAYCQPGFESSVLPLATHDLHHLITNELESISAIPRIVEPEILNQINNFRKVDTSTNSRGKAMPVNNFGLQEHRALRIALSPVGGNKAGADFYRSYKEASLWWQTDTAWNAEFIKQTPFRQSHLQEAFVLRLIDETELGWYQLDTTRKPYKYTPQNSHFQLDNCQLARGCYWWFDDNIEQIYQQLAERMNSTVEIVSDKFGEINLRTSNEQGAEKPWHWHPQLGVYESK